MNPERLQQIETIFADALACAPDERERVLVEQCGSDMELMRDVKSLLESSDGSGAFDALQAEFADEISSPAHEIEPSPDSMTGARVGRYRLVREIGRGGMGAVYLAERADGEFEQVVALKLLRQDLGSGELRERFLAERQILARVVHPNIARLLDGGVTDDGWPFLVMEYIEGTRLDRYCDGRRLPVAGGGSARAIPGGMRRRAAGASSLGGPSGHQTGEHLRHG